ncbi:MAG: NADH-quinone oxidoreductase subunit J, partial [Pyrinomonadaceae bacterium]|nr:NADH-quinone oxidoreductase subunit J [Phycisphaerales bacterium]
MQELFQPILLYIGCALGALGVALAMPRRGVSPQVIGGLVAGGGFGAMILAVSLMNIKHLPNINFYVFSLIAIGASLRVITHPRPVYSALYFILTILASSGLYVILAAEFMAFALIIVYAGAILITYLFVIMLATEAPSEMEEEQLQDYDRYSREPIAATIVGFVLLASLTTMLARGAATLPGPLASSQGGQTIAARDTGVSTADLGGTALLAQLPRKVETALRDAKDPNDKTRPLMAADEYVAAINVKARTVTLVKGKPEPRPKESPRLVTNVR